MHWPLFCQAMASLSCSRACCLYPFLSYRLVFRLSCCLQILVAHLSLTCRSLVSHRTAGSIFLNHCQKILWKKKSRRSNICGTFSYLLNNTLGVHSNNSMYRIIPELSDFLSLTGIPLLSENSFLFHRFRCCSGICIFWDVTFFISCTVSCFCTFLFWVHS